MTPVLFTLPESVYDGLGCDTYNKQRNALSFIKGRPVIAHPPCRSWSRLRAFAKPLPGEKWLGIWAALYVNKYGGVLEHPASSSLFSRLGLLPNQVSDMNGFVISVDQKWFGHPCQKKTWLYINGCEPADLPALPLCFNAVEYSVEVYSKTKKKYKNYGIKAVAKEWRKKTPEAFALWLMEVQKIIETKKA